MVAQVCRRPPSHDCGATSPPAPRDSCTRPCAAAGAAAAGAAASWPAGVQTMKRRCMVRRYCRSAAGRGRQQKKGRRVLPLLDKASAAQRRQRPSQLASALRSRPAHPCPPAPPAGWRAASTAPAPARRHPGCTPCTATPAPQCTAVGRGQQGSVAGVSLLQAWPGAGSAMRGTHARAQ